MPEQKKVLSWKGIGAVFLVVLLIAGSRFIAHQLVDTGASEKENGSALEEQLVSSGQLMRGAASSVDGGEPRNLETKKVAIDFLSDGKIIVDGEEISGDDFEDSLGARKESGRRISLYVQPETGSKSTMRNFSNENPIIRERMPFSPRFDPRR